MIDCIAILIIPNGASLRALQLGDFIFEALLLAAKSANKATLARAVSHRVAVRSTETREEVKRGLGPVGITWSA